MRRINTVPLLLAILFLTGQAQAHIVGPGRTISLPHAVSFDKSSDYADLLQVNDNILRFSHSADEGWSGGCAKFYLQPYDHEAKSGLGAIRLPNGTRQLHIRWLQKYGPDFIKLIDNEEWKLLIIRRSGAERIMVLDWHYNLRGRYRTLRPCANIDCAPRPNTDQREFSIDDYLGQWICIELGIDADRGIIHLYIDTPDGEFKSNGGVTPFATKTISPGDISSVDIIAGYWEGSAGASPDHYIMIDEMKLAEGYIGPPKGFTGSGGDAGLVSEQYGGSAEPVAQPADPAVEEVQPVDLLPEESAPPEDPPAGYAEPDTDTDPIADYAEPDPDTPETAVRDLSRQRQQLLEQERDLRQRYEMLEKEKQQLAREREEVSSPEEVRIINQVIRRLNQEREKMIGQYMHLKAQIEAYNRRLGELLGALKP